MKQKRYFGIKSTMAIELGLDLPWEVLGVRFISAQDYIFSSLSICQSYICVVMSLHMMGS